ncbi:MAG: D-isomer specific 2-hydroxyacid dehydrogenase family protein [Lacisediminihabitans sp.]
MSEAIVMPDGDALCDSLYSNSRRKAALDNLGGVRIYTDGPLASSAEYVERCGSARAIILGWPLPSEVLALPQLDVVTFMGTGAANHVDIEQARAHNVAVCNTPGYGDAAVAEHTLALLLASLRGIPEYDAQMHAGNWPQSVSAPEVSGATVGIVGFGGIGSRVAQVLHAMGAHVLCWTREPEKYRAANPHIEFTDLDNLMSRSEIVSLHLGLTDETRGIITADRLDLLQPGALVVNTARAELVDENHLVTLVARNAITVALDVFSSEPLPPENPYRQLTGAVLTPHVAFNTPQAMERMADITVRNLEEHFAGNSHNRVA